MTKVLILGGDGYLGWPTAMRFSATGNDVHVVDNYLRRDAHHANGTRSLTPIARDLPTRVSVWEKVSGRRIACTEPITSLGSAIAPEGMNRSGNIFSASSAAEPSLTPIIDFSMPNRSIC